MDDPYGTLERFWQARLPDRQGCDDDCGNCWACGVKYALNWSFAVLSNPALADHAQILPPFIKGDFDDECPQHGRDS